MADKASEAAHIDSGTLLGIISLLVAILSTLVCLGQVIQQYVATGNPIRLCDTIVYGGKNGLPGTGRKVWLWRQFRYRVLYDIPQISLVPLSPSIGMFVPFLIKPSPSFDWPPPENKLMSDLSNFTNVDSLGQASWVAFCRVLLQACPGSVIVNRVTGDADRCPADMTNIPMPISLRDLAIFCLFVGMECTSASFVSGTISMAGPTGTITSSQHPTLGSCVHYAAPQDGFRLKKIGTKIDNTWLLRVCGRLRIGNVVLVVGAAHDGPGPSGLRSPFEDSNDGSVNSPTMSEKFYDLQHVPTSEVRTILLPSLDYYWMSQMSVVPGYWATPFRGTPGASLNILWGASQVTLKLFSDVYGREDASPMVFAKVLPTVMSGEDIVTFPPYGVRHGLVGGMLSRETYQLFASTNEMVESSDFDCHIPKILIRKESLTPATHCRLDDHYDCSIEIMAIDVWLHVVARSVAIMAGQKQILHKVPNMVQEVMTEYGHTFESVALGTRSDLEHGAKDLATTLRSMDLSGAETMYLLVALLRTVKVGLCIGLGNDTSPLLEIIEKDVQAHLL